MVNHIKNRCAHKQVNTVAAALVKRPQQCCPINMHTVQHDGKPYSLQGGGGGDPLAIFKDYKKRLMVNHKKNISAHKQVNTVAAALVKRPQQCCPINMHTVQHDGKPYNLQAALLLLSKTTNRYLNGKPYKEQICT